VAAATSSLSRKDSLLSATESKKGQDMKQAVGRPRQLVALLFAALFVALAFPGQAFAFPESRWDSSGYDGSVRSGNSAAVIVIDGGVEIAAWRADGPTSGTDARTIWYSYNHGPAQQLQNASTASAPTLVQLDGRPYLIHRGTDNRAYISQWNIGSHTFTAVPITLPDILTLDSVAATAFAQEYLQFAWIGTNRHMYTAALRPQDWTWFYQGEIAGGGITNVAPAVTQIGSNAGTALGNRVLFVHTGTNDRVFAQEMYYSLSTGDRIWTGWQQIGDAATRGRPSATVVLGTNIRIAMAANVDGQRITAWVGGEARNGSGVNWGTWDVDQDMRIISGNPTLYNSSTVTGEARPRAVAFSAGVHLIAEKFIE
jgi:hypothetical protein